MAYPISNTYFLCRFLAVVALRLLKLKEQDRNGQILAKNIISDLHLEVIAKRISRDPDRITLREFWIEVTKNGRISSKKK